MTAALIGIDWGTTHRRACLLDQDGKAIAHRHDDQGMLACAGRFRTSLETWLHDWMQESPRAPIIMSGMVGAASGWQEAPYLDTRIPLTELPLHLMDVHDAPPGRRCAIVPGYRLQGTGGRVDVMRGEETQLLGALALGHGDGWYVLPGTHSKWVHLDNGMVSELCTYMTGELFALLTQHGTLAAMTAEGSSEESVRAFEQGMGAAGNATLSHTLFACRAKVVTGGMPASQARSYLSGLLIGTEWSDAVRRSTHRLRRIHLISSPGLADRYRLAAQRQGCELMLIDPAAAQQAAMRGLATGLLPSSLQESPA
jgi:2-dehydro-3-deoxygalactonokinase